MKKVMAVIIAIIMIVSLSACEKKAEDTGVVLSGEVSSVFALDDGYFTIDTESGKMYGFVITDDTKIDYGDQLARLSWFYTVDVVCGLEIEEIPSPYAGHGVINWYYADSIKVTGNCEEYFGGGIAKPVIYLYPVETANVTVTVDLNGTLTCTYPKSDGTWNVTADPDGTLTDAQGQEYNYLYWEGKSDAEFDFSKGFCVKGEDTAAFLETALFDLGLTRREANEFIVYWLPLMEVNEYNIIAFQTDVYEENAKLTVEPAPDTVIRVFMAWYGTDKEIDIVSQELTAPERTGFTVIEWGGSQVK